MKPLAPFDQLREIITDWKMTPKNGRVHLVVYVAMPFGQWLELHVAGIDADDAAANALRCLKSAFEYRDELDEEQRRHAERQAHP